MPLIKLEFKFKIWKKDCEKMGDDEIAVALEKIAILVKGDETSPNGTFRSRYNKRPLVATLQSIAEDIRRRKVTVGGYMEDPKHARNRTYEILENLLEGKPPQEIASALIEQYNQMFA